MKFGKKSLAMKSIKKQVKTVETAATAPLIGVLINLADGATITTSPDAMQLVIEALGEDTAVNWHVKYVNKFDKLTKQCWNDFNDLVKKATEQADK